MKTTKTRKKWKTSNLGCDRVPESRSWGELILFREPQGSLGWLDPPIVPRSDAATCHRMSVCAKEPQLSRSAPDTCHLFALFACPVWLLVMTYWFLLIAPLYLPPPLHQTGRFWQFPWPDWNRTEAPGRLHSCARTWSSTKRNLPISGPVTATTEMQCFDFTYKTSRLFRRT